MPFELDKRDNTKIYQFKETDKVDDFLVIFDKRSDCVSLGFRGCQTYTDKNNNEYVHVILKDFLDKIKTVDKNKQNKIHIQMVLSEFMILLGYYNLEVKDIFVDEDVFNKNIQKRVLLNNKNISLTPIFGADTLFLYMMNDDNLEKLKNVLKNIKDKDILKSFRKLQLITLSEYHEYIDNISEPEDDTKIKEFENYLENKIWKKYVSKETVKDLYKSYNDIKTPENIKELSEKIEKVKLIVDIFNFVEDFDDKKIKGLFGDKKSELIKKIKDKEDLSSFDEKELKLLKEKIDKKTVTKSIGSLSLPSYGSIDVDFAEQLTIARDYSEGVSLGRWIFSFIVILFPVLILNSASLGYTNKDTNEYKKLKLSVIILSIYIGVMILVLIVRAKSTEEPSKDPWKIGLFYIITITTLSVVFSLSVRVSVDTDNSRINSYTAISSVITSMFGFLLMIIFFIAAEGFRGFYWITTIFTITISSIFSSIAIK